MLKRAKLSSEPGEDIESKTNDYSISLVNRVAKILACLSDSKNTLNEIVQCSNLSRSTVHRLLNALLEPHLTVYDAANHRYYLGPLITRLSSKTSAPHQYLISCSIGDMQHLSEITNETVSLSIMVGSQLMSLYVIESKQGLKATEDFPVMDLILPFGAAQKELLSQLDDKAFKLIKRSMIIWAERNKVPIDFKALESLLKEIRKQGYVVTYGEKTQGSVAIAAPVKNYVCPAAVTVAGPECRFMSKEKIISKELVACAKRISANIKQYYK
jgi:DNA-binding IclR family transcriptional regulator